MKKLIAFDLDRTLTASKAVADDRIVGLLSDLLDKFQVCVISGGDFHKFEKQLLSNLKIDAGKLERLHLMPTCGTRYYVYEPANQNWRRVYAEDFTPAQKQTITAALNKGFDDLGYRENKVYGACVEDRGGQITFSALGQDIVESLGEEGVRLKEAWDPDNKKKLELRDYVAGLIPEFEVRVGGATSIDVTKPGIDKAYGMEKLIKLLGINKKDILFVGDRLQPGGNDYPVKTMGVDSLEVADWHETATIIESLLKRGA